MTIQQVAIIDFYLINQSKHRICSPIFRFNLDSIQTISYYTKYYKYRGRAGREISCCFFNRCINIL